MGGLIAICGLPTGGLRIGAGIAPEGPLTAEAVAGCSTATLPAAAPSPTSSATHPSHPLQSYDVLLVLGAQTPGGGGGPADAAAAAAAGAIVISLCPVRAGDGAAPAGSPATDAAISSSALEQNAGGYDPNGRIEPGPCQELEALSCQSD